MFHVEHLLKTLLPGLVSRPVMEKFEVIKTEYFKWNKVYNISSIKDEEGFWIKHVVDSLCLASYIYKEFQGNIKILDIGSGGGFPGLVLALALDNKISMVEPVGKKTGFIEHIILKLGLKNAEVIRSRYEDIKKVSDDFLLVSRALGNYQDLKKHFLEIKPDVKLIVMTTNAIARKTSGKVIDAPYAIVQQELQGALIGHVLLEI